MNEIQENMRVYVSGEYISGSGTIIHLSNAAYCPVQVELDQPDEDGHCIYRFHHVEVKPLDCKENTVSEKEYIVELVQEIPGYSLRKGGQFTARPSRPGKGTHYLIYKKDKLRGCFPISQFRTIKVIDIPKILPELEAEESIKETNIALSGGLEVNKKHDPVTEVISEAKIIDRIKERQQKITTPANDLEAMEYKGQATIFDFI